MNTSIKLNQNIISEKNKPFIIAEIGNNHNGSIKIAKELIDKAAECGASSVKFQTKDIETAFTKELLDKNYENENSFGKTYREHKQALELDIEQIKDLKNYSEKKGLTFFSTAFDIVSLKKLESIGQEIHKISSFHVTDLQLIEAVCKTNKPIIISTGMSTIDEIDQAVNLIKKNGNNFVVLHCVSSYPTKIDDMNLKVILTLKNRYDSLVGYSGHETSVNIAPSTVLYGACVIERHFTLDRSMKGPDHAASLEPAGLELLVKRSNALHSAMGSSEKKVLDVEIQNRLKFRGY